MAEARQQYSIAQLKQILSEIETITVENRSRVLQALYDYIMQKIKDQGQSPLEQAENVIFWILLGTRPLSGEEIRRLVELSINHDPNTDGVGHIDINDALYPCRGLMTLIPGRTETQEGHIVDFSHGTIRQYVMQKRAGDVPGRHADFARILIQALTTGQRRDAIYEYAVNAWHDHYHSAELSERLDCEVERLLRCEFYTTPGRHRFIDTMHPIPPTIVTQAGALHGIHAAAQLGLDRYLPKLLLSAADINSADQYGTTPLIRAAGNNHANAVEWLLKNGANLNSCDVEFKSAIHYAAMGGCDEALQLLIAHGGARMVADIENMTPIHYAVKFSMEKGVDVFLNAGVSIDTPVHRSCYRSRGQGSNLVYERLPDDFAVAAENTAVGYTPLHFAVFQGNKKMVDSLLKRGASTTIALEQGETVFHVAVTRTLQTKMSFWDYRDAWNETDGRIESAIQYFNACDEGYDEVDAEIADESVTILQSLLRHGVTDVGSRENTLLLDVKANLSLRDHDGRTPLHLACLDSDLQYAKLLLEFGSNVFDTDDEGRSALHYAAYGGYLDTIKLILGAAKGCETQLVQSLDKRGRSPLHYAAAKSYNSSPEIITFLTNKGAEVNLADDNGVTPLAVMFTSKSFDLWLDTNVLETFLSVGAATTYESTGGQGLHHHYASSYFEMNVEVLLILDCQGLDLTGIDSHGRTMLHHCTTSGSLTIQSLEYLRDVAGLDVTLVDGSGKTALEYSRERAKKRHHKYTFDCSRWRRTESLLASWAEGNRESLAEAYKVGECPEELHYSDNSALYSPSKIGIGWT